MTKSVSSSSECTVSPCTKAAQRVSRKYNSTYRRKLQRREYKNLKKVLPAISSEPKVSKADVIEEAIKYIDYLHAEIANRFYSGGVFRQAKEQSPMAGEVKRLALHPQQKVAPHPSLLQHPQAGMFQFSQGFIEAGSQIAGAEFLHYQNSVKSAQTQQQSTAQDLPAIKTTQLRL